METWSKGKSPAAPQIPFVEEVVEEVQAAEEEPEHSVKLESPSHQTNDLVSAIKRLGKMKSEGGKVHEPDPFTGREPKKLKTFIFQCMLYFRSSSEYDDDAKKVNFALSYLWDVAQEWFEPGISGLTEEPPAWLESFPAFLHELRFNFGPYDETGEAERELATIHMKDSARISDYMVKFASLAIRCPWGESALRYRFYDGLPARIKDKLSKLDKPQTLEELQTRCQHIDARYWEQQQERAHEQRQNPPKVSAPPPSTSATTPKPFPPRSDFKKQKPVKTEDVKPTIPHVDLTGKLDSQGKLTQQERQHQIDKNLCLFCGGSGHHTNNCPVKAVRGRAAIAESSSAPVSTPAKPKESGTEKKKD